MMSGEDVIRDPGQKFETGLVLFYFVASVVMLANGWMTHSQSIQQYDELMMDEDEPEDSDLGDSEDDED